MKKKNKDIELGYRIADIRTMKFIYGNFETEVLDEILANEEGVTLVFEMRTEFDVENNIVMFDITTELNYNEELLINHIGRTAFEINGFDQLKSKDNDGYEFPNPLLEQLYGISFSHTRALLATETARTNFNRKFYLPVVDPRIFIKTGKETNP